jgi:predicted nucleic acid-binding protein
MAVTFRVYADSSVFGGVFDEEFMASSAAFFEQVRSGRFRLVVSPVIEDELAGAPEDVRALFDEMASSADAVGDLTEAVGLRRGYVEAGIVGEGSAADALHVATATISGCRAIVSWNFKHIVHMEKIPLYNGVNMARGYPPIGIYSPMEVIRYAEEEDV